MRPIVRQTSVKVRQQANEVEQRSDIRIRLTVIVAEETFVVTGQARKYVGSGERIIVRKALVRRKFESTVEPTCTTKATDCRIVTSQVFGVAEWTTSRWRKGFTRVEDEVSCSIVERTVFNNRTLRTVNSTEAQCDVFDNFIFETCRKLIDRLRLQTLVDRGRMCTQVTCRESASNRRSRRSIQRVYVEVLVGLRVIAACSDVDIERD